MKLQKSRQKRNQSSVSRIKGTVLFIPLTLLVLLTLFVVACAGGSTTTSTPSPTATAQVAEGAAAPTMADVNETAVAGAVTVHITMKEFSITSSQTTFRAGIPYYFIVANQGHDFHEFLILPGKIDGQQVPTNEQLSNDLVEIEPVGPGTTQKVNYTFPSSTIGQDGIACMMRGHYMAGMHLSITVTK